MSDSRESFIEGKIISAVKRLLIGRVNDILGEYDFELPEIEFGAYAGGNVVVPTVSLVLCERTEKERLLLIDAYALAISFSLPGRPETDLYCYAFASAVEKVMREDRTLGGVVDRTVLTLKKYTPPKKPHCGEMWNLTLTFHLTVEGYK